jgi:hypothetical protein
MTQLPEQGAPCEDKTSSMAEDALQNYILYFTLLHEGSITMNHNPSELWNKTSNDPCYGKDNDRKLLLCLTAGIHVEKTTAILVQ